MRPRTDRHTQTHTQTRVTTIHFASSTTHAKCNKFAVWVVDSGGPKEAQVQSCSPGGANMPTWEGTLAPPGEYD